VAVAVEDLRRREIRWRSSVALVFQVAGFPAESRTAARRVSDELFENKPDVTGVPGIHVLASPVPWSRVSHYLTKAVMAADERGQGDVPVLVLPRQLREPSEAYVVLTLSGLAQLVRDAQRGREV
jgi:hypothetical protein